MINIENAIEVQNISKTFRIYKDKGHTAKEIFLYKSRRDSIKRDVIKNLSFDVKKGEAIGLIGCNGCGKSTTLKMLTRIMYPDSGSIEIEGRVSSLIELGAGFHPDMTGRENIYINASIFGLSRVEIERRIPKIIKFSELEEFIDNPVRTYSSGMYMRLAFSVAINVDAEVLLIDEILGVGDANFQAKCFRRLKDIKNKGTTIVIVSHSLGQIEAICDRSIWLQDGVIGIEGEPRKVHREYLKYMGVNRREYGDDDDNTEAEDENSKVVKREGNQKVIFEEVKIYNAKHQIENQFERGDDIIIEATYKMNKPVKNAYFAADIIREDDGMYCFATNTIFSGYKGVNIESDGKVVFKLKNVQLIPHRYYIDIILKEANTELIDIVRMAATFEIFSLGKEGGIAFIENEWEWG